MKRFLLVVVVTFMVGLTGVEGKAQTTGSETTTSPTTIGGTGKANYLPLWKTSTTLGSSVAFQKGSGASAQLGIGTASPLATLDVNGTSRLRGNLTLLGSLNGALTVQGNVKDPCSGATSANVIGGLGNTVTTGVTGATIVGGGGAGLENTVTDDFGTVGGGEGNRAGNNSGTTCDAMYATVSGGLNNSASGDLATVSGGQANVASGQDATVVGGGANTASGLSAIVVGGASNTASGSYSLAAGSGAKAADYGSFVWCSANGSPCTSLGPNSFQVSAYGPIYFYDGPNGSGCNLSSGGGSWNCSSDRNLKDDITSIDSTSVLERVANMPITQWKMKAEPAGLKHIGPMAQDFYAAFGLGDNDRYIALGDGQGVALAAIQALYKEDKEKDQQIKQLTVLVEQLQMRLTELEQAGRK